MEEENVKVENSIPNIEDIENPVVRILVNILLYLSGIVFFLMSLSIFINPMAGLVFFLLGFLLFPPAYRFISGKIEKLKDFRVRLAAIILLVLSFNFAPHVLKEAYITAPEAAICAEPDGKTGCETFVKTSLIKVDAKTKSKDGYARLSDKKWINEKAIAVEGSDEFKKMRDELGDNSSTGELKITLEDAKLQAERKAFLEKIFSKMDVKKFNYEFYINPVLWHVTPLDKKKELMQVCASYAIIASRQPKTEAGVALGRTYIKSSLDGKVIGKFSPVTGYDFK